MVGSTHPKSSHVSGMNRSSLIAATSGHDEKGEQNDIPVPRTYAGAALSVPVLGLPLTLYYLCHGRPRSRSFADAKKLYFEKKWSGAIDAYQTLITDGVVMSDQHKHEVYFRLGYAYDEIGNRNESLRSYAKAIDLDPNHADSFYNRGVM